MLVKHLFDQTHLLNLQAFDPTPSSVSTALRLTTVGINDFTISKDMSLNELDRCILYSAYSDFWSPNFHQSGSYHCAFLQHSVHDHHMKRAKIILEGNLRGTIVGQSEKSSIRASSIIISNLATVWYPYTILHANDKWQAFLLGSPSSIKQMLSRNHHEYTINHQNCSMSWIIPWDEAVFPLKRRSIIKQGGPLNGHYNQNCELTDHWWPLQPSCNPHTLWACPSDY